METMGHVFGAGSKGMGNQSYCAEQRRFPKWNLEASEYLAARRVVNADVEFAVRNTSAAQLANSRAKIFLFTAFPFVPVKAILAFLLIPSHSP